jgi:hypothetical protein
MRTINEVEQAVRDLSPEQLAEFRRWFAEFDARVWDAEFEGDVAERTPRRASRRGAC